MLFYWLNVTFQNKFLGREQPFQPFTMLLWQMQRCQSTFPSVFCSWGDICLLRLELEGSKLYINNWEGKCSRRRRMSISLDRISMSATYTRKAITTLIRPIFFFFFKFICSHFLQPKSFWVPGKSISAVSSIHYCLQKSRGLPYSWNLYLIWSHWVMVLLLLYFISLTCPFYHSFCQTAIQL